MKADRHEGKNKAFANVGRLAGKRAGVLILVMLGGGLVAAGVWLLWPQAGAAHCDTLDGPVVKEAKAALEKKDVTPVLKWVKKEHEAEIKDAFKKTLAVRTKGKEAKALADMYFFETLVRLHRAGEGAPYTGLKSEGEHEPAVEAADKALETGSSDELVKLLTKEMTEGLGKRFDLAKEKKKSAGKSVDEGREFVEAYVDYVHYAEGLYTAAAGGAAHHGEAAVKEAAGGHDAH